ncbi:MAG: hypothetical protein QOD56_1594 [Gammaproteobacteria bacterium]|nr:hypothetical protein [Gammaproteobacteria bacterium]
MHNIVRGSVCAAALVASPVLAAEYYIQPVATLTAENDSNLDLDPGVKQQVQGYLADLAALIGIDTPQSATILRPRITYRYYPKESADNRLEAYLDLNTTYRTQRSVASLVGSIQHLDLFNAELSSSTFNDVNPNQPPPDTGRSIVGATRDSVILYPKYQYSVTPLLGLGANGQYQLVKYSPSSVSGHVDFDYYMGRVFGNYAVTQTSTLLFGGFGSKYEARRFFSQATGKGATVELDTNWTALFSTRAALIYQITDLDAALPQPARARVNAWGGTVNALYKTQITQYRLLAGRQVSPSGGGSLYNTDRVQFEYDRNLTARWDMTAAVIGLRTHALTQNVAGYDRKYLQTLFETRYSLTQRWFVQGGYAYAWQKYQYDVNSAANNRFYVQVGYKGLGQQR